MATVKMVRKLFLSRFGVEEDGWLTARTGVGACSCKVQWPLCRVLDAVLRH